MTEAVAPPAVLEQHDPAPSPAPAAAIAAGYQGRCARLAAERDRLDGRLRAISYARLAAFCAALAVAVWALVAGVPQGLAVALLPAAAFVALVVHHADLARQHRRCVALWQLNAEGLRRLARDWDGLPLRPAPPAAADCAFATDLDLFGRASLVQLLGATSALGEATLGRWLLEPAPPATVRARQAAVAELAPLLELRNELAVRARLGGDRVPDLEPFLVWAEGDPWLLRRPRLLWSARALAVATCAALVAQLAGVVAEPVWLWLALVNVVLSYTAGKEVDRRLGHVTAQMAALEHYAEQLAVLAGPAFQAPLLQRLQATLSHGDQSADRQAAALVGRVRLAYIRQWMFYVVIEALTLWSFHALASIEAWQAVAGQQVRGWLAALAEVEALAALGALAHDQPEWPFPNLTEGEPPRFVATALGHPLLADDVRVPNDVEIGPPGTVLLVTGSNMSGKSTLLRAIGVNVVLAQAGAPVCAAALRLPPVMLGTSIRVQDSLEQGMSYFMAELRRLKAIVDAAEHARASGERTPLFLLDEILHGTNTAERQIAARHVILHLVAQGAIGAVSTHDLTLAASAEMAAAARPVHFAEQFVPGPSGLQMTFDYRLRPGLATSTNALRLMELVGLAVDAPRRTSPPRT